jgi:septal ring factor EnvC (AmiA/AmiB activator)
MKLQTIILLFALSALLMACSKSDDQESQEHFLSDQQRALERAQNVNNVIQQTEEKKRQQLESMER